MTRETQKQQEGKNVSKRRYMAPRIVSREPLEALAGACATKASTGAPCVQPVNS